MPPPNHPQSTTEALAQPFQQPGDATGAAVPENGLPGLISLPPDLRAFLRSRSVTEIAQALRLDKGMASRAKRGIYPHAPLTLLKRWDALKAAGAVPVSAWALRRVLGDATAHAAVLYDGVLYSGAGLLGMRGHQIVVARAAHGGLIAQTLAEPAERFSLVQVEA